MIRTHSPCRIPLALGVASLVALTGCDPKPLFSAQLPAGHEPPTKLTVLRSQNVKIDPGGLVHGSRVVFNALDQDFELNPSTMVTLPDAGSDWVGTVKGQPNSLAAFARRGDIFQGFVRTDNGALFELRYAEPGIHTFRELSLESELKLETPQTVALTTDVTTLCEKDSDVVVIGVFFTAAARDHAGGQQAIEALVGAAVSAANATYHYSGIRTRLAVNYIGELDFNETGSSSPDLNSFIGNASVSSLREEHHLDLVTLLVENTDVGGLGTLLPKLSRADSAFSLIQVDSFAGGIVLEHEMGHNMGARHDAYQNSKVPSVNDRPYSQGWVRLDAGTYGGQPWGVYSIMAYGTECRDKHVVCWPIPRWSSPEFNFGDPQTADNRRTLNESLPYVASFKCGNGRTNLNNAATFISTNIQTDMYRNYWYLDTTVEPRLNHLSVTFKNTGTAPWNANYRLRLVAPADNKNLDGGQLLDTTSWLMPRNVDPGDSVEIEFDYTGSGKALHFQWQLETDDGRAFGDVTPDVVLMPKGY